MFLTEIKGEVLIEVGVLLKTYLLVMPLKAQCRGYVKSCRLIRRT